MLKLYVPMKKHLQAMHIRTGVFSYSAQIDLRLMLAELRSLNYT